MTTEGLVDRALRLKEIIDRANMELEAIKDQLRGLGRGDHSGARVSPPARRFNAEKAAQTYIPRELHHLVSKTVWDEKGIKGMLTPDQLDESYSEGTGKDRVTFDA